MNIENNQWVEDKGMQYPYKEYREGDFDAGADNTAWGKLSTDPKNKKKEQQNG
jgi:hypothetical protein